MPITPGFISNANNAFGLGDPGAQTTVPYDPPVTTGTELGRAISTTTFGLTTTLVAYAGLSVPVVVPAGVNVYVECELPGVLQGAATTTIALEILRDNVQVAAANQGIPANNLGVVRCSLTETPAPGIHIYSASIQLGAASAGAISEGGSAVFGLYAMFPYIRVVTC